MRRFKQLLGVVAVVLVACAGYVWLVAGHGQGPERRAQAPLASPPSRAPQSLAEARVPTGAPAAELPVELAPTPSPALDDAALMTELRSLLKANPERALALARDENQQLPASTNAPERAWIAVRALDDLRRFHEAQAEARLMLERYPGTHFTEDAERHTLVYPLDQSSREAQQAAR